MLISATASPDMDRLSALHKACFARGWSAKEFSELLAVKGTLALVAEDYIGFGLLRIIEDEAEVLTLAVAKEHQKQGVGKAVMLFLLAHAKTHGAKSVFLEVKEDNVAARALYDALGFAVMLRRKKYYRMPDHSQKDAIVMCKDLA